MTANQTSGHKTSHHHGWSLPQPTIHYNQLDKITINHNHPSTTTIVNRRPSKLTNHLNQLLTQSTTNINIDIPCPMAEDNPQQDGRRGENVFRNKPHTSQRCLEGSKKTLCTPGPRNPTRHWTGPAFEFECLLLRHRSAGTIKLKKLKKSKNDHKNISRTFSGFVVSIVGSVHFWLVPWSDLYFSRSNH